MITNDTLLGRQVRLRSPRTRLVLILSFCITFTLLFFSNNHRRLRILQDEDWINPNDLSKINVLDVPPGIISRPTINHGDFMADLASALLLADPGVQELKTTVKDPGYNKTIRIDVTPVSAEDLKLLKNSHEFFLTRNDGLAQQLPYTRGTKGVVMTAGGSYINMAIISIRMLRRSGSRLPVELILDSKTEHAAKSCQDLSKLDVICRYMDEALGQTPSSFSKPSKYQFKIFAILFSSFEKVLFLDSDTFPIHNPDSLLDSEPFKSTGLVTWPDFWVSTVSHYFYEIVGISVPDMTTRLSSESGIILYNKATHSRDLVLAAYYNYYGPKYYYPLLSQGAAGEGDKETFLHAALVLQQPFYAVVTHVGVIGNHLKGEWNTAGLVQADPVDDWKINDSGRNTISSGDDNKARPLFIHHNQVKLDFEQVHDRMKDWVDDQGSFAALWGTKKSMEDFLGYDAESVLWHELLSEACKNVNSQQCLKLKDLAKQIYPELP